MATTIRNREVKSGKRKTKFEELNITKSNQPQTGKLKIALRDQDTVPPLFTFDSDIEEEESEEIPPQLARLCERLGVDHTKIKLSAPKLPWECEEASNPNSRNDPEFTQAELFPGKGWRF